MELQKSMSNTIMYTTVQVVTNIGTGTGFFYEYDIEGETQTVPCLITNKHVIEGASSANLLFRTADDDANVIPDGFYEAEVNLKTDVVLLHPDEDVDLCAIPLAPFFLRARQAGHELHYRVLSQSLILYPETAKELNAVEDIIMVGYPIGLSDEVNNLPIIRKGITASHLAYDYNGNKEFLIDAACFPGSSGSPVFLLNEGTFYMNGTVHMGIRFQFLGILYAGPHLTQTGQIVPSVIPTSNEGNTLVEMNMMINLGFVIKAERLLDFEPLIEEII
ncbi:S1 family peptidase [Exiguobacterium acetylicum]|uniref:Trypsin-like peptidase domain-containing protein n=1 Tax=Exiguobacterium acetylicum TaxID=41170 RepID=A0ABX8GEZ4_EXIAC|nr:serine protease [Exiguobacterium acetylicum]QWB31986.1 trypsin-like peptidase domain-containing protein [Exiguobacterium acetylicum]